jgi:hypothetical protein
MIYVAQFPRISQFCSYISMSYIQVSLKSQNWQISTGEGFALGVILIQLGFKLVNPTYHYETFSASLHQVKCANAEHQIKLIFT